MKHKPFAAACFAGLLITTWITCAAAERSASSIIHNAGAGTVWTQGGAVQLDREWTWTAHGGFRIGVSNRFELALPLTVTFAMLKQHSIEVAISGGVTDWWTSNGKDWLYTPAVHIFAKSHLSTDASAFYNFDYTHVQSNFAKSPGFLRGAAAFWVDMGPYLSWCMGMSYQRILVDHPLPDDLHRSGLAGAQRVTIGSVRATPYSDLPLFTIKTGTWLNFTIHARLDIDTDTDTTDARILGGIQAQWGVVH